jgi:hypothetical protein
MPPARKLPLRSVWDEELLAAAFDAAGVKQLWVQRVWR